MSHRAPRMLTYATAVATVIAGTGEQKDKLLEEKFKALRKSWSFVEAYAEEGFAEEILDAIMEKKAEMILKSTSIQDVREIANPPEPYFDGSKWRVSKNSVPEEEMVWWSKASLRAPLTHEAVERYEELFKQSYDKSVEELIAGSE